MTSGSCGAATCPLSRCAHSLAINPLGCPLSSTVHESGRARIQDSYTTRRDTILKPCDSPCSLSAFRTERGDLADGAKYVERRESRTR